MKRLVAVVCAGTAGLVVSAGGLDLAVRGQPAEYRIVLPAKPTPVLQYAAEEFRDWTERMTGVRLPIETNTTPAKAVYVGGATEEGLGTDGFRIRSEGVSVRILGSSDKRGVLYGVYELLETYGGIGWFASWSEDVPVRKAFAVPDGLDRRELPAFASREPFWFDCNRDTRFAARIRKNAAIYNEIPERFGGQENAPSKVLSGHSFELLLPPKVWGESHPEYFSEIKGRRRSWHSQPCLSNSDVIRIMADNMLKQMRLEPSAKTFAFSANDWFDDCTCAKCRAINEAEGSRAGTYARALTAVAEIVGKEFPDKFVEGEAYQWTRQAPKRFGRFPKNVIFSLSAIECDWSCPLKESPYADNVVASLDLSGWARCAPERLMVWDFNTSYADRPLAFPNVTARQANLRWYRDLGAFRVVAQGSNKGDGAAFGELKAWLDAKLMWNPDRDVKALLDRFFAGFYGPAAPFARQYFDAVEALPRNAAEKPLRCMEETVYDTVQTDEFLEEALHLWDEAVESAKEQPKYLRAAELGKFSVVYTILRKACPMLLLTENSLEVERLRPLAKWAVEFVDRHPTPVVFRMFHFAKDDPQFATWRVLAEEGAEKACRHVFEESCFWFVLRDMVSAKADPGASEGRAARIGPDFWAWCLQRTLTHDAKVDDGQTYRVRVRARLDLRPGAVKSDMAMSGGVSCDDDGVSFRKDFSVGEMSQTYAWYDLGEWDPVLSPSGAVWLALGKFDKEKSKTHPSVAAVWIDQLALEPVRPVERDALKPFPRLRPPPRHLAEENLGFQGCPSLTASPGGRLWAAWMCGKRTEDDSNADLLVTSGDGGKTWSEPLMALDAPGPLRALDGGLWTDPDGDVWFFYGQTYGFWDGRCGLWAMKAKDPEDPKTEWTTPRRLCDGYLKNKPTVLSNGDWLFPVEFFPYDEPQEGPNDSFRPSASPHVVRGEGSERQGAVFVSRDRAQTLAFLGRADIPRDQRDFPEGMIVEKRDGRLWMPLRTMSGIAESFSSDGGRTWTPVVPSRFVAPSSRFFIRRLGSGALLMVKNGFVCAEEKGRRLGERTGMTAWVSDDDGETWTGGLVLDARQNVSYPDGVETADGFVHVIHDFERRKARQIVHHVFTEADVRAGRLVSKASRLGDVVSPRRQDKVAAAKK